jgi:multidrug resistance efflux pump
MPTAQSSRASPARSRLRSNMPTTSTPGTPAPLLNSLRQLQKIRNFDGEPAEFWRLLLETLIGLCGAEAGLIVINTGGENASWKTLALGPDNPQSAALCKRLSEVVTGAAEACAKTGFAFMPDNGTSIVAVHLLVDVDTQKCLALFRLAIVDEKEALLRINALLSANDIPAHYRTQESAYNALKNQEHLTDILDLMALLNSQHRFMAAAMMVCNELAGRYTCDRVSLGWLQKGYVRVRAMSHTDDFEKKMEAVQQLELAMEEALDQEADIVVPAPAGGIAITRDHEAYAKTQDVHYMATFPVRKKDEVVALFSFERDASPLDENELRRLRVTIDQLAVRLAELRQRDRWFGARLADWLREKAGKLLGYEHTWAKLAGVLGAVALIVVALIPVRYRVDSPMILHTDDISYITAPFDGYIDSAGVKPGDLVETGKTLLSLDKKDLLLEESGLMAEKNRESREVEKARAAGELADMCIAQARYDQVAAKLDVNHFRLAQADIPSPYDGVVIEGDLHEKIGSPVKQGEVLFKIGRLKDIYAQAKVSENEIHNIKILSEGQIALASRPQEPFDIVVTLVEPSAIVAEKDNVFPVRCKFKQTVPSWFRPGMTGISKINAGHRTLLWIASHRTIDVLRLKLWW